MRCKKCGRTGVPEGSLYCNWCGKKLETTRALTKEVKIPEPKQLPSGNWFIQLRIGGESISITEPTSRQCAAKARAIKSGIISGRKNGTVQLATAIDKYIESKSNILSPSTVKGYRDIQRQRFKSYMDKDIYKLTQADYQKMVNEEATVCSAKTLSNAWRLVNSAIKFETGQRINILMPQIVAKPITFWEPEEIHTFCAYIKGMKHEIPFLLGLSSLRRSEIFGLTWDDIDLDKRVIHVSGAMVYDELKQKVYKETNKNVSSNRNVPIMMDQLYDALCNVEDKQGLVVTAAPSSVRNALEKACKTAGVQRITMHGLRHSFASLAAHLQVPLDVTKQIGGWADDRVVKRVYTHIYENDIQRSSNAISDFFNSNIANENANGDTETLV